MTAVSTTQGYMTTMEKQMQKWLEGGWSLQQVDSWVRVQHGTKLGSATGLETHPFISRTEARVLSQDPSLLGAPVLVPPHPRSQAPAYATSFFGRGAETTELKGLLSNADPVTVVGPGGSGKTRLVVECQRAIDRSAAFVDLTRLRREGDIRPVVAGALGLDSGPDDLDR